MAETLKKANIRFTYRDYRLMPEDRRYELIDGDFYMTPSPVTKHQLASIHLERLIEQYVRQNNLGTVLHAPMDVVLSDEDVVQPDILFISNERKGIIKPENIRGAPDLIVEILSPATAERDLTVKKGLYAKFAVREYWIVDPDQKTVAVMTWSEEGFRTHQVYPADGTLRSPIFPGWSFPLKTVFDFA